ncbi:MAG: xanthine dehydrogenase family protein molybdopterin-binding subunit [Variovorax sp.]|nr:xanthine dehydrogenase family protein molybdopterin-binding subunit [Variovorax sp.]
MTNIVGQGLVRVDGRDKVCGRATYAAEFEAAGMVHAVLLTSTVARGRVERIDTQAAEAEPGVLAVITARNAMPLPDRGRGASQSPAGRARSLLQDDSVSYNGEPVAIVVADTLERAAAAARLLRVRYSQASEAVVAFDQAKASPHDPGQMQGRSSDSNRGNVTAGLRDAVQVHQAIYTTPIEHHNPMEPHATIAQWNAAGDRLTVHDSTQAISGSRDTLAKTFGIATDNVVVLCPFVGGGFGCKGSSWSHVALAAMASRQVGRPVKLVLERPQMFGSVGHRPHTEQTLSIGAAADGQFTALHHGVVSETSMIEDWTERSAVVSRMLYACDNQSTTHRLARMNIAVPTFTRAPGEASGCFALECAVDEMATLLAMDPLALRLRNYTETDPDSGLPFSSKSLRECYRVGAERFGWRHRPLQAGTLRDGHWRIGMGMATATYPTNRSPAEALVRMMADGAAVLQCGSQDLGTGTLTVMAQVAADALGIPVSRVRFELGDSRMPKSPGSGGSQTAASVAPAVQAACLAMRAKLVDLARTDGQSSLRDRPVAELTVVDGWVRPVSAGSGGESVNALIGRMQGAPLEARAQTAPGDEKKRFSMHAFGAVFAEVRVDDALGIIRVPRIVGVYGVGNRLNARTAHSQLMGGIVWGVGMALFEETWRDERNGRYVNASLAEYHVPVNADIGDIDVQFVPEDDPHVNPLGVKGIGEIGITGVAAAIANAVYHATGKRVRDLPVTLDKLI